MSRAQTTEKSLDTQVLFDRYHIGWVTRDPDLIASLHSDDTLFWLHDEGGPINGREALRKHCVELFARYEFGLEEGRMFFGPDYWIFEWKMVFDLAGKDGKPFTGKVEMLDVVTVNPAGEVTRKDVYMNGAQRREAISRAGLGAA